MENYINKTICIRAKFTQPLTICDDGSDCCNNIQMKYGQVIICEVVSEGFIKGTLNARVLCTNIAIVGFNINYFDVLIINHKKNNKCINNYYRNINRIRKIKRIRKNLIFSAHNIVPGNYLYSREDWSTYQYVTVFLYEGRLYVKINNGNYLVSGLPCDCIFVKTKKKFSKKPIFKYNNIFRSKVLFDKMCNF